MVALLQSAAVQQANLQTDSIPAPVRGWNTRDPLDGMEAGFAPMLDNWFPQTGFCEVRNGYASHATGVGSGAVETVAPYRGPSSERLIAAGGGSIYNASAAGAATSLASSFTNNRWQHTNFKGNLFLCNGADAPQTYNGTTVAATGFTGTGLTPSDLIDVHAFKQRLFYVEKDSASFWYASVSQVTGTLTEFDLSEIDPEGGSLVTMGTLTNDGGDGPDDLMAFIMSNGSAIIYAGTDPGSASAWGLVGIFRIGRPIGRRCVLKRGADLIVLTADGYIPLLQFLSTRRGRSDPSVAVSDNISGAANDAVRSYSGVFGWQPVLYPEGKMLVVNVPLSEGASGQSVQHVMNTVTGAWCRFTGLAATSFVVHANELYFGSTGGIVYKADTGRNDNGASIVADGQTAYQFFGSRGRLKKFNLARGVMGSDASLTVGIGVGTDFTDTIPAISTPVVGVAGSPWDTSPWDTSPWSGGLTIQKDWQTITGEGISASLRLTTDTRAQQVRWYSSDIAFEVGGIL